jgi:hypothetical protein
MLPVDTVNRFGENVSDILNISLALPDTDSKVPVPPLICNGILDDADTVSDPLIVVLFWDINPFFATNSFAMFN